MTIRTKCRTCAAALKLKDEFSGKTVQCPRCKSAVVVPVLDSVSQSPTDDIEWLDDEEPVPDDLLSDIGSSLRDDLYSPVPSVTKKKKSADFEEPTLAIANDSRKILIIASLIGGMFLVGLLLSAGLFWVLKSDADIVIQDDKHVGTRSAPAVVKTGGFDDTSEMARQLPAVLDAMQTLLLENKNREFLLQFAPLEDLARLKAADIEQKSVPPLPRQAILTAIEKLKGKPPEILSSGWVACLKNEETVNATGVATSPGYGGDLKEVIRLATIDLEEGRYSAFVEKIIPASAKLHLMNGGADKSVMGQLSKDSPLVLAMLADLKDLQTLEPQIRGDTAVFVVRPAAPIDDFPPPVRSGNSHVPQNREIRFSLIGGSWRFFDNLADDPDLSGVVVYELTFDRVGNSWRLAEWPR